MVINECEFLSQQFGCLVKKNSSLHSSAKKKICHHQTSAVHVITCFFFLTYEFIEYNRTRLLRTL